MKRIIIDRLGGIEVFHKETIEMPSLDPGHIVIQVAASAVNPIDIKSRTGIRNNQQGFPAVLGWDQAKLEGAGCGISS